MGSSVVIAVLTYQRPQPLERLLDALVAQCAAVQEPCRVLVVDNDPAAGAAAFVEAIAARTGGLVTYVHEPRPGIAAGRNRALQESFAEDVLVFIDDDELPGEGWLAHLLSTRAAHPTASGVVGAVVSAFDQEPGAWVAAGDFFARRRLRTGTEVDVAATNNLLIDLDVVRGLGLRFDEDFGISGGSDTLFTRRLASSGRPLVWCDEAVVVDRVPASRTSPSWVLRRALRSGNSWSRTSLVLTTSRRDALVERIRLTASGSVRFAGGGARWGLGVVTGSMTRRARGARTVARGAGMISGAYGYVYREYRR